MIAGIISGGAVALMWLISGIVYLYKRHERAKRARQVGVHRRDVPPRRMPQQMKWEIPPDPAWEVLQEKERQRDNSGNETGRQQHVEVDADAKGSGASNANATANATANETSATRLRIPTRCRVLATDAGSSSIRPV
jgi:hypothetical protein